MLVPSTVTGSLMALSAKMAIFKLLQNELVDSKSRVLVYYFSIILLVNPALSKKRVRRFPDGFQFGAATSAYQIEGGWDSDGKNLSIWDDTVHDTNNPVKDYSTGDVAADSYRLYKRDVEIMKELGLDFYRFSVSWPRILPNGFADKTNEKGLEYYNNLINEMIRQGIQPFLTMYHWDLPSNLQKLGGWANPAIVDWFRDYAKVLYIHFGDRVKHWITINEPKQICYEGYGSTDKAPAINMTGVAEYLCAKNVLLAHAGAYHLYDEEFRKLQNGSVGISVSHTWFEPASETMDDYQAAADARQFDWGQYDNPIFSKTGDFPDALRQNVAAKSAEQGCPRSRLPELTALQVAYIRGSADFLGVNTYTSKLAYRDASLDGMYAVPSYMDDMGAVLVKDPSWPQATSTWLQEVPWGFTKILLEIKRAYDNPPVYITENGWSTDGGLLDESRIKYYRNYLNALLDAIEEGCDVRGYTAWSMIDNFEWMSGYTEKFGLYEVDFSSSDKIRTPRKSAFIYKEIIRSRTLDPDYEPESFIVESQEKTY